MSLKTGSTLKHDSDEIRIEGGSTETTSLYWRKITRVVGWKRDCLTYDQIRLTFETVESTLTVTEDDYGWNDLLRNLPDYLPGFPSFEEWCGNVMLPPFELCETVLFQRTV